MDIFSDAPPENSIKAVIWGLVSDLSHPELKHNLSLREGAGVHNIQSYQQ